MNDAAVVIVNFRTPELALRCARAAYQARTVCELVVVDSGSCDRSAARLQAEGVPVLALERNAGFAAAVNAGFAATSAPFVVLLNADVEVRPNAIDRLVNHLREFRRAGVAAPTLLHPDGSPQWSLYRRFPGALILLMELSAPLGYVLDAVPRLDPYRVRSTGDPVAHASAAALAARRAAYEDVGGFDEGFFLYLEETEWQHRLSRRGWSVDHVPEAHVVHLVRGGGMAAETPSPHFVAGARRYLELRGSAPMAIDLALGAGVVSSSIGLRLLAALFPRKRRASLRRARAYESLWPFVRGCGANKQP